MISGSFLIIPAIAPVSVVIPASIPSAIISPTVSIPASITISTPIIISAIIPVITGIVSVPISMIIGNHNTQSVFLLFFQDGFLQLAPVLRRGAIFEKKGTEITGLPGVDQFLKNLRVAFQFGCQP